LVGVAVKLTAVPEQTVVLFAAIITEGVTAELTDIVTALLVAVEAVAHEALLVNCKEMISPFTRDVDVYVALVAPLIFTPFFFHWYTGVDPPLVMAEVNCTELPEQILFVPAVIETVGVTDALTTKVTALLVAVFVD
jgi:hypothetical protein